MRNLYRAVWRRLYRNPEYLRYSGTWDTVYVAGKQARPARWYDLSHWVDAWRDEWWSYTHAQYDD